MAPELHPSSTTGPSSDTFPAAEVDYGVVGRLLDAGHIEQGVIIHLRRWLPYYLNAVALQNGRATPAQIRSYAVSSEYERLPEQGLPALIVEAAGTTGEPEADGDGSYSATWELAVSVTVSAAHGAEARKLAQMYGAAVRGALLQRRALDKLARVTSWLGEAYGDVSVSQSRTTVAAANAFEVTVRDVVNWLAGPATDEPPGPSEWAEIQSTEIQATHRESQQEERP